MTNHTLEIRPKVQKNVIFVSIVCAIFTLTSFSMLFSGEEILAAILGIIIFGGGGIYGIPKMIKRKVTMVLNQEGIEQRFAQGNAFIHWDDIEKIGIVKMFSNKMVGIRLKSYDNYLNEMPPSLANFMMKSMPFLKLLMRATSLLDIPVSVTVWSKLEGQDLNETIESYGEVENLAQALFWSREKFGYDIALSWAELDRPSNEFVNLLEEYSTNRNA